MTGKCARFRELKLSHPLLKPEGPILRAVSAHMHRPDHAACYQVGQGRSVSGTNFSCHGKMLRSRNRHMYALDLGVSVCRGVCQISAAYLPTMALPRRQLLTGAWPVPCEPQLVISFYYHEFTVKPAAHAGPLLAQAWQCLEGSLSSRFDEGFPRCLSHADTCLPLDAGAPTWRSRF
jgi:hypothetical protein